VLVW
jgi:hypothetical protein